MKEGTFITIGIMLVALSSLGGYYIGNNNQPTQEEVFGMVDEQLLLGSLSTSHELRKDYYVLCQRLKNDCTFDLATGSVLQWSQAIVETVNNDLGISVTLQTPGGTINDLVQQKLGLDNMLCSDPNSTATKEARTFTEDL